MASIQKYREKTGGKINRNSPQKKCKKGFFSCIPRDSQKKRFFPSCDRTAETAAKSAHRLLAGPREDERLDTGRCTGKCETFCVHSPPAVHGVWEAKTASRSPLPYMNTWAVNSPQQGAKHCVSEIERDSAGVGKCQLLGTVGDRVQMGGMNLFSRRLKRRCLCKRGDSVVWIILNLQVMSQRVHEGLGVAQDFATMITLIQGSGGAGQKTVEDLLCTCIRACTHIHTIHRHMYTHTHTWTPTLLATSSHCIYSFSSSSSWSSTWEERTINL